MEKIRDVILANLPVGILVIGGDGLIIEANPASCEILSCPSQGFVGNRWGDVFLSQEENLMFTEVVLDAIQKETPKIERITPYYGPDGSKKYLSVISSAQREEGKITAIIVLIEDLTELHELHEREKNILAQNHRLAAERADSLINFARSVAHQIRNPIMAIAGFARLLERKSDESAREALDAIQDETVKLETTVRSVSEYSAINAVHIAPVNLWMIIEEAKNRIAQHSAVEGNGIVWRTDCPDMNIKADKVLMVKALAELMLNGAEFGGPGSEITICATEINSLILLAVADNGPGFTDSDLEMAMDPFYTTKPVGAGMGLTRAKRIVSEHMGDLDIGNCDAGGAVVRITLPIERT